MINHRLPTSPRSRLFHLGLALLTFLTLLSAPTSRAGELGISVSPDKGPLAGGNQVVISVLNPPPLGYSLQSVKFGANPAMFSAALPFINVSSVPAGTAAGPVVLTVTYAFLSASDEGDVAAAVPIDTIDLTTTYTYEAAAPQITNVSPPSIPAIVPTGGTEITLTGTNLSGITEITGFGMANIPVTSPSATEAKFTIPAGTYPVGSDGKYAAISGSDVVPFSFTFTRVGNPVLTINRIVPSAATPNNVGLITLRAIAPSGAPSGSPFTALTPAAAATQTSKIRPGTVVTVTAVAKAGFIFGSWNGDDTDIGTISGRSFSFTMPDADVTLNADFVANPFASLPATTIFRGILSPDNDTASSNATRGSVVVSLATRNGDFSGNFLIDGVNLPIRGYILGDNSVWFIQGPVASAITSEDFTFAGSKILNMCLCEGPGFPFLGCTVHHDSAPISGDTAAEILGGTSSGEATPQLTTIPESVFNRASVVGGPLNEGYFTASLTPRYNVGACPAFITITRTGRVNAIGNLSDGTSLTMSTNLCQSFNTGRLPTDSSVAAVPFGPEGSIAVLPLHAQLRTPGGTATQLGGSLLGSVELSNSLFFPIPPEDAPVAGVGIPQALQLNGNMTWLRPSVTQLGGSTAAARATQIYTEGWPAGISVSVSGSQYDASITVQDALLGFGIPFASVTTPVEPPAPGNAVLSFTNGKLPNYLSFNSFNILGNAVVKIAPIDRKYTLAINQRLGQISGTFTPTWTPRSSALPTFTGALIQSSGFFIKGPSGGYGTGYFISNIPGDLDPESGNMELFSTQTDM